MSGDVLSLGILTKSKMHSKWCKTSFLGYWMVICICTIRTLIFFFYLVASSWRVIRKSTCSTTWKTCSRTQYVHPFEQGLTALSLNWKSLDLKQAFQGRTIRCFRMFKKLKYSAQPMWTYNAREYSCSDELLSNWICNLFFYFKDGS